jgi:hypothetical protein
MTDKLVDLGDPNIIHVLEDDGDDQPQVIERSEFGPILVSYNEAGYAFTTTDLRDLLVWCLGPGRDLLAKYGLVVTGSVEAAHTSETRVCLRCGHPSSTVKRWCDRLIPKTGILCCDGDCCYPGDPGAEHVKLTDWPTNEER